MKRIIVVGLVLVMLASVLVGCNTNDTSDPTDAPTKAPTEAPTEAPDADAGLKTGVSVSTSVAKSKDAGEEDGTAQSDILIIAVAVDEAGIIQDCAIDFIQAKIKFNAEGKLVSPIDSTFLTKRELGDDYGMKKASGIGREWFEQAEALEEYVTGKTLAEVKGISLNDSGQAADAELSASVTIKIGSYISGIEAAVMNATDLGAKTGDKIGIGTTTGMSHSKDATDEASGTAQAYADISVVTVDSSGKITSCIIDAVQANVKFTKEGKIETDLAAAQKTKLEKGDDYGMKKASAIGKEWYEQANAFSSYVTGKTVAEVKGIALDDTGLATDAEILASTTVHIGPFIVNIEKAADAAD